jgi:hypothetical protein
MEYAAKVLAGSLLLIATATAAASPGEGSLASAEPELPLGDCGRPLPGDAVHLCRCPAESLSPWEVEVRVGGFSFRTYCVN